MLVLKGFIVISHVPIYKRNNKTDQLACFEVACVCVCYMRILVYHCAANGHTRLTNNLECQDARCVNGELISRALIGHLNS